MQQVSRRLARQITRTEGTTMIFLDIAANFRELVEAKERVLDELAST